jgi:hypothetical protein
MGTVQTEGERIITTSQTSVLDVTKIQKESMGIHIFTLCEQNDESCP